MSALAEVGLSSMFAVHPLLVDSTTAGTFMCTQTELPSLCLLQNNKGLCPQLLGYSFADEAGFGIAVKILNLPFIDSAQYVLPPTC
jgi:hypothetical protein